MAFAPGDPFINAKAALDQVKDSVLNKQDEALARAFDARDASREVLMQMGAFAPQLMLSGNAPVAPRLNVALAATPNLPPLSANSFGSVARPTPPTLSLPTVAPVAPIEIDEFLPSFSSINIPIAPELATRELDAETPALRDIAVPDRPLVTRPLLPSLDTITVPEFIFPTLPAFDAQAPEFIGSSVSSVLQYVETPFQASILTEEMDKLRSMWDGKLGLPPEVEQALWERAASREDVAISRDISAAAIEFSSRGFALPPGMLINRIDTLREDGQIRKLGLSREILVQVSNVQIENLRFACTQAIASENLLFSIDNAMAQRQFDAARIQLDSEIALYNSQIALFNASQSAYNTEAGVYRIKVDGELAKLQVFRTQLDGEIARGQVNEQRVRIYSEQVRATLSDVEIYRAQVQGAQLESDLQRQKVEIFRVQLEAFAQQVQTDRLRFDAYDSQVRGETAKASLVETQARAYAAYVSGQSAKADIDIRNQQAQIAANDQQLRAFVARVEQDRAQTQADLAVVQANAEAHRTNTARYVAQAGAEQARVQLLVSTEEANQRNAISLYQVESTRYIADMEQMIRVAGLQLEALKSAAQSYSTLAAGAMAGISLGTSVSGSASVSASGSRSDTTIFNAPGGAI